MLLDHTQSVQKLVPTWDPILEFSVDIAWQTVDCNKPPCSNGVVLKY